MNAASSIVPPHLAHSAGLTSKMRLKQAAQERAEAVSALRALRSTPPSAVTAQPASSSARVDPLSSVIGYCELMLINGAGAKQTEYLKKIQKSGAYLNELIGTILDLTKAEAGRWAYKPERVDAAACAAEAVDLLS